MRRMWWIMDDSMELGFDYASVFRSTLIVLL